MQMPSKCIKEDCVKEAWVSVAGCWSYILQDLQISGFYHGGALALEKYLAKLQIYMFGVVPLSFPTYVEDTLFHGVYV
jgi:hypothetical protein